MNKIKSFEDYIFEKNENIGKYNTVKKVVAKLGRRPSEQELAKFITDNYYDVTGVERGDDDSSADDKIADLVAFYKFDIEDWEVAWEDAQNESVITEGKYDFMNGLSIQFNGTEYTISSINGDFINVYDSRNNKKTFRFSAVVDQNPGIDVKPAKARPAAWNKALKSDAYSPAEYKRILKGAVKDAGGAEYAYDMAQSMINDPGIRARIEKDYPILRSTNQMIQRLQWDLEMYESVVTESEIVYHKHDLEIEDLVERIELVHVYDEDGKMFGTGELVKTKGKKSLIRWDGSKEEWVDSNLVKLVESKESDALAKAIDKAMIKIDDSMSYEDFALAVGKILKEEYGSHLFGKFMEVLHKDLGI